MALFILGIIGLAIVVGFELNIALELRRIRIGIERVSRRRLW